MAAPAEDPGVTKLHMSAGPLAHNKSAHLMQMHAARSPKHATKGYIHICNEAAPVIYSVLTY